MQGAPASERRIIREPAELMGDSAKMNMWPHKTVLKKIADNGGNVPAELWS